LLALNQENVKAYSQEHGIRFTSLDELRKNERIRHLIEAEVAQKNRELASFEAIKKIMIVPEFTIEDGSLTPTLKIKKNVVAERYRKEIEALYAENYVREDLQYDQPRADVAPPANRQLADKALQS
jgi:long-chain acyl-CoA synthetase